MRMRILSTIAACTLAAPALGQIDVLVLDGEITASGFGQFDPVAGWEPDPLADENFQGIFANSFFDTPSVFARSSETSGGLIGVPSSARGAATLIASGTVAFGGSSGLFFDDNLDPVIQVDGFSTGEFEVQEPTLLASGIFSANASGGIDFQVQQDALVVPDSYDASGYDSLVFEKIGGAPINVSNGIVAIPSGNYRLSFSLDESPSYPADFPGPGPFTFGQSGDIILLRFVAIDSCAGDANFDGMTNFGDVTIVLNFWLNDYGQLTGLGDADRNGVVNFSDISTVLGNWLQLCNY